MPIAILGVALFITVFDNGAFFRSVLRATLQDQHQAAILLSMGVLVLSTLVILLSLAVGVRLFKAVAVILLLVAATCGFFMSEYGIVIDTSMIRNVVETEIREASPLVTSSFLLHLTIFGIVPALLVVLLPLKGASFKRELAARAGLIVVSSLSLVSVIYFNYGTVSFFGRQNHELRLLINPGYPLYAYARFLARADDKPPAVRTPLAATIEPDGPPRSKPVLLVFVMGETARADRFAFNGYSRDTNRYTRPLGVVNFPEVASCGTSTAESLPCLFSRFDRDNFSHAKAAQNETVFLTLKRLGVNVFWRDNSTGCKDVCDPAHFEQLAANDDAELCDSTGCFDEILLQDIDRIVTDDSRDQFIVLHQRGSHGPAYHTDTPVWSKDFLPECDLPNLRNCDRELINNAYDNTIVYTDYFLSRVVGMLKNFEDRFDVAMLYVSDHGESLGEKGLYLHGLPYAIAPAEQTRVPMLFWASADFYASEGLRPDCLRREALAATSHDALFHTLLPLFDVSTPAYDAALDLFAGCREDEATRLAAPQRAPESAASPEPQHLPAG
jgi:lipid A ethanolaminephosphotransferase